MSEYDPISAERLTERQRQVDEIRRWSEVRDAARHDMGAKRPSALIVRWFHRWKLMRLLKSSQ